MVRKQEDIDIIEWAIMEKLGQESIQGKGFYQLGGVDY
jgi:hypothetical protein